MTRAEQQFRRIQHLAQSATPHLVDSQFRCVAEAVLDGAQDAEHILTVALELKHGVDDMLQHFRAGNRAVLGDMADQKHRHGGVLGIFQEPGRALANLTHAACRRFQHVAGDGLNRVYHDDAGTHVLNLVENPFQ